MIDVCFVLDQTLMQYQQNEQSPLILTELADRKQHAVDIKKTALFERKKTPNQLT
jgi:hypothetical protein